jgi:hypothetical protein
VISGLRREENRAVLGIRKNGVKRNINRDLVEKTEGKGHLEDLDINGRVI